MNLVCFTEEKSAKAMLDIILPKILPNNCCLYQIIPFEGKQDLDKQIEKKIKNYKLPDTRFLVLRDQDSAVCTDVKQDLLSKIEKSGKKDVSIVRIACHELESFYLGDLTAVEKGLSINNLSKKQNRTKFKNPDNLNNAKEELQKIAANYQQISGAKSIAPHLKLDNSNKSISFNFLVSGVQKLCNS